MATGSENAYTPLVVLGVLRRLERRLHLVSKMPAHQTQSDIRTRKK